MRISIRCVASVSACVVSACMLPSLNSQAIQANENRLALPGYRYSFPRDFFSHPEFQTEWWYYTGNLHTNGGRRFGFELTFFRQGVSRETEKAEPWDLRDIYLAHLALSDLDGGKFYHIERVNRSGPGIAGADEGAQRIWNGNWLVQWRGDEQDLQAVAESFEVHLVLQPEKTPVIHGENGVSQKAEGAGRASHYISLTRIATTGTITLNGQAFDVSGVSWMDHEFFTNQLTPDQTGWDWLSIQLEDRTELMLFHIRRKDGSVDRYSAGTYVDAAGKSTHLRESDFVLRPTSEIWRSAASGAAYPIQWRVQVPKLGLQLEVQTPLANQELTGGSDAKVIPTYWEGAIRLRGQRGPAAISGLGYLEMTGYAGAVQLEP